MMYKVTQNVTNRRQRGPGSLRPIAACLLLVILLAWTAATAQTKASPEAPPTSAIADSGTGSARVRVGPGDLLKVQVFDVPELTQEVRVSDRGEAVLTFLGPLRLAGLSAVEAQALVENRLRAGWLCIFDEFYRVYFTALVINATFEITSKSRTNSFFFLKRNI